VVSRIEDPSYGKLTVQSLLELASAFDVGLLLKFTPIAEFVEKVRDVSEHALQVASFDSGTFAAPQNPVVITSLSQLDAALAGVRHRRRKVTPGARHWAGTPVQSRTHYASVQVATGFKIKTSDASSMAQ
jgi:hypothetical protein